MVAEGVNLTEFLTTVEAHEGRIDGIESAPYATESWVAGRAFADAAEVAGIASTLTALETDVVGNTAVV
jgi:hypothetical protein